MIASTRPLNEAMAHQLLSTDERANLHHQHIKKEAHSVARRSSRHGQQRDSLKQITARVSPSREKDNKDPNKRRSRLAVSGMSSVGGISWSEAHNATSVPGADSERLNAVARTRMDRLARTVEMQAKKRDAIS